MSDLWKIYTNYRAVEADLITLSRYIDLDSKHNQTTSSEIRKIIFSSCSFIEKMVPDIEEFLSLKFENKHPPSQIYKHAKENKCSLEELTPVMLGEKYEPWKPMGEGESIKFSWWEAYNDSKHNRNTANDNLKSAIESVVALFSITVLLTGKRSVSTFWNRSDFVKIQTNKHPNTETYYSNNGTILGKNIWSQCGVFN